MTASLTQPAFRRLGMKALLVQHDIDERTATGRAATALAEELRTRLVDVVIATSADDACAVVAADPAIQCLLLNWELGNDAGHAPAQAVLDAMRARNATVPVFLLASRASASAIPVDAMRKADDFIWLLEDTTAFIGGRIVAEIGRAHV